MNAPFKPKRRTKLYQVWNAMKQRCANKKHPAYSIYGARGITVCDEWLEYDPFYFWAKSNGYRCGLSLDRIDNDGNYSPGNCRWATKKQQAMNRRIPKGEQHGKSKLTDDDVRAIRGSTESNAALARRLGVDRSTVRRARSGEAWSHV